MKPPIPKGETGQRALRALIEQRNIFAALQVLHQDLGDVFALPLPGFNAVMLVGPDANRFVLTGDRDTLHWRIERDPLVKLLRHGFLVEDGAPHDEHRAIVSPGFHNATLPGYVDRMVHYTDWISGGWEDGTMRDMFAEMRRITLPIIVGTLTNVDISAELGRLWRAVIKTIDFISPGLWILFPEMPRPGYARARHELDEFLYRIIGDRRRLPKGQDASPDGDVLSWLVRTPGMTDDLIRDQILTLLIAGHDTSTALLAWALYLLGKHPAAMQRACAEVEAALGNAAPSFEKIQKLQFLDQVIKETLRLYPPIHIGNRMAAQDFEYKGWTIPTGTRVLYSIYLTHRHPAYWREPDRFIPERFADGEITPRPPFTYVPFGGGPRFCIGATFAQLEAKVILARLLQRFRLEPVGGPVRPHMGATLEARPSVRMRLHRKQNSPDK